jgi:hypothetical protein
MAEFGGVIENARIKTDGLGFDTNARAALLCRHDPLNPGDQKQLVNEHLSFNRKTIDSSEAQERLHAD